LQIKERRLRAVHRWTRTVCGWRMETHPEPVLANDKALIRPFDGSLADAEGVLAVERATFDESPYGAPEVRVMLSGGPQRAWLAVGRGRVVGFVIAFATLGLRGRWWEIDLLAILPSWRGRRLATRLIRAAAAGAESLGQARAVVATDNNASLRAFARAGFEVESGKQQLLICRAKDLAPRQWSAPGVTIREAAGVAEASAWLTTANVEREYPDLARTVPGPGSPGTAGAHGSEPRLDLDDPSPLALLLAEREGQLAGHAELVQVQTLLYRGVWIESLAAADRTCREALLHEVVQRAQTLGLDEIGAMVPESNRLLQQALSATGFRSLGDYYWLRAALPLSGSDVSSNLSPQAGEGMRGSLG